MSEAKKLFSLRNDSRKKLADSSAKRERENERVRETMAAKSHVISGCYERFVLGHEARLSISDEVEKETNQGNGKWTQKFAVKAHQGPVKCVKAKGGLIVSGGDDDCVRIYDLVNGKDLGTLVEHEGTVSCLDMFMPEGAKRPSHLFSGGVDGLVNVWRVKDFKLMSKLRGHKKAVKALGVHSSGKLALSCDQDSNMCMWNLIKGRVTYKSKLETPIEELLLSQVDNKYVGRTRNSIVVRDLENPEINSTLEMDGKSIVSFCYPGTNYVLSGSANGMVGLWDLRTSGKCQEFKAHNIRVKGLAVPYDLPGNLGHEELLPNYFVSASSDGDLKLWDSRKIGTGTTSEPLAVTQMRVRLTCLCAKVGTSTNHHSKEGQSASNHQHPTESKQKDKNRAKELVAQKAQVSPSPKQDAQNASNASVSAADTVDPGTQSKSTFIVKPKQKKLKNQSYKQKQKKLQQKLKRLQDKDKPSEFD